MARPPACGQSAQTSERRVRQETPAHGKPRNGTVRGTVYGEVGEQGLVMVFGKRELLKNLPRARQEGGGRGQSGQEVGFPSKDRVPLISHLGETRVGSRGGKKNSDATQTKDAGALLAEKGGTGGNAVYQQCWRQC